MLGGDSPKDQCQRERLNNDLYASCDWNNQIKRFYSHVTSGKILHRSRELQHKVYHLDVVKE